MLNTLFFCLNHFFNDLLVSGSVLGNYIYRFNNLFDKITMNPL
ncbi:hypothetical protein SAMN05421825_2992 [Epilithonimonas hungarica]|uniref:Uncharacterized protein n=1 Tax=Epilithonimonas hungarica TaxID=454006 RepID=A0A1G7SJD6_9FLAO|nr:hypothetical protein [Epilithonimonas hungarica]SDG23071.1 hypothetical protein SAMN05421825_2992 [Epilithonimonas hungarica]